MCTIPCPPAAAYLAVEYALPYRILGTVVVPWYVAPLQELEEHSEPPPEFGGYVCSIPVLPSPFKHYMEFPACNSAGILSDSLRLFCCVYCPG